jgi:protein TonB
LLGLAIAELAVLSTLEFYRTGDEKIVSFDTGSEEVPIDYIIQTKQVEPPKPIPPAPVITEFKTVDNNTITLEDFVIDAGVAPDQSFPDIEAVADTKEEVIDDVIPFTLVEKEPSFPGGEEARIKFLQDNLVYPKIALETGQSGVIRVGFVVEKDGSITDVKILRGEFQSLCEEALRVTKMMPKWEPGIQRQKKVRVSFYTTITFSLQ